MRKGWNRWASAAGMFLVAVSSGLCEENKSTVQPAMDNTSLDLFSLESDYIGKSRIRELGGRFGSQDALSEHLAYGHRFLLRGQWYLRAGLEYNHWDFGGAESPLPSHLQSIAGTVALEYVVQNYAGAAIELHPGLFSADKICGSECFDIPWDAFAGFPIQKEKLYGTLGISGAQFYAYPVIPIFGVIWLVRDNLRLEVVFPRSTAVFTLNKHWEFNLGWELTGGGFRAGESSDPRLSHTVVEYYENRGAGQLTYSGWKPVKLTVGAGWAFGRTYDYFRADQKFTTGGAPFLKIAVTADF